MTETQQEPQPAPAVAEPAAAPAAPAPADAPSPIEEPAGAAPATLEPVEEARADRVSDAPVSAEEGPPPQREALVLDDVTTLAPEGRMRFDEDRNVPRGDTLIPFYEETAASRLGPSPGFNALGTMDHRGRLRPLEEGPERALSALATPDDRGRLAPLAEPADPQLDALTRPSDKGRSRPAAEKVQSPSTMNNIDGGPARRGPGDPAPLPQASTLDPMEPWDHGLARLRPERPRVEAGRATLDGALETVEDRKLRMRREEALHAEATEGLTSSMEELANPTPIPFPEREARPAAPPEEDDDAPPLWASQTMEAAGEPKTDPRARVPLPPDAHPSTWPEKVLEGAGETTPNRAARMVPPPAMGDPAQGSTVEGAGHPVAQAWARADDDAAWGDSLLEGAGETSAQKADRLRPPPRAPGEDTLAAAGDPSASAKDRLRREADGAEAIDGLASAGETSTDKADRLRALPAAPGEDTLAAAGEPSSSAKDRLRPEKADGSAAGDSLAAAGEASTDKADRLRPPPAAAGEDTLAAAGEASTDKADRLRPPPAAAGEDTLAAAGDPSDKALDRLRREKSDGADGTDGLAAAGDTSSHRADRLASLPAAPGEDTLAAAGDPSDKAADRLRREKPDGVDATDSLAAAGAPSDKAADRLRRERSEGPSTLEGLHEGGARLVPPRPADELPPTSEGAGQPVDDASARLRPPPTAGVDRRPTLEGIGEQEGGRLVAGRPAPTVVLASPLEGAVVVMVLSGADRDPAPPAAPEPPPPPRPSAPGEVARTGLVPGVQACGRCGGPLRLVREEPERRLDFAWQSLRWLTVHRPVWDCPSCPSEPARKATDPAFAARRIPVGNGLLAELICARYEDHTPLAALGRLLASWGCPVSDLTLAEELARLSKAVLPVAEAVRAEVMAHPQEQDPEPARYAEVLGQTVRKGALAGRSSARSCAFFVMPDGKRSLESTGKSRPLARLLTLATVGRGPDGVLGATRQRFRAQIWVEPERAGRALHLLHGFGLARGLGDVRAAEAALRAWAEAERATFVDPSTGYEAAVVYVLAQWERLVADPPRETLTLAKGTPREWGFDAQEGGASAFAAWCTLIASCQRNGLRPWRYLNALLEALAAGRLGEPEGWRPDRVSLP